MTDESTRTTLHAAALDLRAALLTAAGDNAEAAADARLRLPDLRAAVDAARDVALDPDPPEPPLPELLPDVAAVDALLADDDPVTWFDRRAAELRWRWCERSRGAAPRAGRGRSWRHGADEPGGACGAGLGAPGAFGAAPGARGATGRRRRGRER